VIHFVCVNVVPADLAGSVNAPGVGGDGPRRIETSHRAVRRAQESVEYKICVDVESGYEARESIVLA
jgi:hypothetical protein